MQIRSFQGLFQAVCREKQVTSGNNVSKVQHVMHSTLNLDAKIQF